MSSEDFFLFWGSGSATCWRPMIILEEKGFGGYPNKLIEFSKQEHKGEDVKKLNPRGQVPTFRHGDLVINESKAICHYLENQFKNKGTQLIPDDPAKQALVLQKMYEAENIFDRGIRPIFYYIMRHKEKAAQDQLVQRKKDLADELTYWEEYLIDDFVCGSEFTMADVFLFTYLAQLVRGGISFDSRPNIKKYYEKLSQRPSIQASWPPHFKTSPPTTIYEGV